ncbi:DUF6843 domain-containing protein [Pseudalkalibacillus sp. SCS-8]|uniref:DUF6843 domain-containing protein n=1 Tax=Pseudalkalibacillus nanhaiensis TaxID=3115291 RepID=UPI0032DAC710
MFAMFWRKIVVGIVTTFATLLVLTPFIIAAPITFVIFFYVLLGIGVYGLWVSIFSDVVVPEESKLNALYTFLVHVGFVIMPVFILQIIEPRTELPFYFYFAIPISILFWMFDETLRRQRKMKWSPVLNQKEKWICGSISITILIVVLSWFSYGTLDKVTPLTRHYIPEGYEGWTYVFYDVEDYPALTKEGDYRVIKYNSEGVAWTSSSYEGSSVDDNEFYYISESGDKRIIPMDHVHFGNLSSFSYMDTDESRVIHYDAIDLIFIGTEEEFRNSPEPDYKKFIPDYDPARAEFKFEIPNEYTGWVKLDLTAHSGELTDRTIRVDQNGEATFSYPNVSFDKDYDDFHYVTDDEEKRAIPQELLSDFYYYPDLIVFYIGHREDEDLFPYQEYKKKNE